MAQESLLHTRLQITPLVVCDVVSTPTGVRAQLYPRDIRTYYHTHQTIDLTERELQSILDEIRAAKQETKP